MGLLRFGSPLAFLVLLAVYYAASGERLRFLMGNSLQFAGATCAVSLPLGALLAVLVSKTDVPGRRAAIAVLALLLFVPLYLQAAAWLAGFGQQGWLTLAADDVLPRDHPLCSALPLLGGWRGAVWIQAMAAVPWVCLIVGAGLRTVEPELEEDALLSAPAPSVLVRVTLRRAAGWLLVATLWIAVICGGEITVTDLFQIRTFAEEVFDPAKYQQTPLSLLSGVLAATALLLVAVSACAGLTPQFATASLRSVWIVRLKRWRWPAAALLWAMLAIMVAVPVGNLLYKAGIVVSQTETGRERSWSPLKAAAVVLAAPEEHAREFGWSGMLAMAVAFGTVVLGLCLANLAVSGRKRSGAVFLITAFTLSLPGPVLGVWLTELFTLGASRGPAAPAIAYLYDRTILAPWVAQTIKILPLAVLILWHARKSVAAAVLETATLEGAGVLTKLWRIVVPNIRAALALTLVAAFVLSMGELSATILVVPPGMELLAVRIFSLIHYGVHDREAAISLALLALLSAGVLIFCGGRFLIYRPIAAQLPQMSGNGDSYLN